MSRSRFLVRVARGEGHATRVCVEDAAGLCRLGRGWVVGQPFDREGRAIDLTSERPPTFDPVEASVAEGWWGSFVIASEDEAGRIHFYRDPSGGVPCYYVQAGGSWLFATDARALLATADMPACIDRESLGLALRFPDLRSERTSLEGIRELLPGQKCAITPDGAIRVHLGWIPSYWRPSRAPPPASVRQAVLRGVRCALHGANAPLIQLSGGLDSAIVAAAASKLQNGLAAVNLVTPGPEGDERRFAHEIASKLGLRLHERTIRIDDVDVLRTRAGFLPRPTHRMFAQSMDTAVQQTAADLRHDAVLTGGGGDSVFSYLLAGFATADPLSRLDLVQAFSTAFDEAAIEQVSSWRILRKAFGHILRPTGWHEAISHLSADILALPAPQHPWLAASRRWPPGKRAHIGALVTIHNYLDPFDALAVPVLFPLLHRPVLDASLRISSPDWVAGGWNRSVARQAFAEDLPLSIIRRRSKGTYERFAAELFERNRPAIRDHLLGGLLRDLGIIDTASLEAWFASGQPLRSNRLLALTEAESWCRHWAG